MRVRIAGLRPSTLFHIYSGRLRRQPAQELFAAAGIAVGVALVFAVLVANTSISGSAGQLLHGLTGDAKVQLAARSADGMHERLIGRVERLPGVRHAAPLLRTRVVVVGASGRRSVEMVGATPALALLGGELTRTFASGGLRLPRGMLLPDGVADEIGATSGRSVTVLVEGRRRKVFVGAVLGSELVGGLAGAQAAMVSLLLAQDLTGNRRRVSHILVEPRPGAEAAVRRQLKRIAAGRLSVTPADAELGVLSQAAEPNDRSTALFAGIAAMVGLLFAFNAMLITSAERRRFIADLRMQGFDGRQIAVLLGFEALVLGLMASLAGLALGELLSRFVFDEAPEYLVFAFPVGTERVVQPWTVGVALCVGVLAALLASVRPLFDLRARLPVDAVYREMGEPGEQLGSRMAIAMFVGGVATVAGTTVLVLVAPAATLVGGVTLALATLLVIPAAFSGAAAQALRLSERTRHCNMLTLAIRELKGAKTRSIALAAVGALAIYGSVAIEGAHRDLLRGLDRGFAEYVGNADLWVTNAGDTLTTGTFRPTRATTALPRAPGIEAVRVYRGGLFDLDDRRLWIIGRPRRDRTMIPPSQLLEGDLERAARLLKSQGWATISGDVAESRNLDIGDSFMLPTASGGTRFRVAAVTTNLGWPSGAIILNADDYGSAWRMHDPTALEIDLAPGVSPQEGKHTVQGVLGTRSGLRVQTEGERAADYARMERQGLARLSQISTLLLIAAALAVASALAATTWQRRRRLASLKIQGFDHWQLLRALMFEAGFVIGLGCVVGTMLGTYGHFLAGRYLTLTTGFPAPFSLSGEPLLAALGLVVGAAYAVLLLPGYVAAQTSTRASFQE